MASSLPSLPTGFNNADREYFQHHRASGERGAYLGAPVRSRSEGNWIIPVSRRFQHADGSFAGVVLATIDAEVLARSYAAFDIGQQGAIALFRADGALLARQPFDPSLIGRDLGNDGLFREQLPRAPLGAYQLVSPFDGVTRIAAFHRGERYPLVLTVAVAKHEALTAWRSEAIWRLLAASSLAGLLGLYGVRLVSLARRRQEAERALAQSEADFRLLTENTSDLVTRIDLEGVHRYVSPASHRLLGRSPEEMLGKQAKDDIPPADQPQVAAAIARLQAGEDDDLTLLHRLRRKDGREIWVEASVRSTHNPLSGKLDGAIAVLRDVTERKSQEALLQTLAHTDGLTGLANRRSFDEWLEREWRRSAREALPLSLLLLDVDRFKPFNDTYGHQKGDECLRAVAEAVNGAARRSGDIVARYGGEELAVILPNTYALGAVSVAERIRAAVAALELAHPASPPYGIVTVSIGAATALPVPDSPIGPAALIAAADGVLYAAQHGGRNRVQAPESVPPRPVSSPAPPDEEERLKTLASYEAVIAMKPNDPELDRITRLAAKLFGTPIALVSLVGRDRQTFASRIGMDSAWIWKGQRGTFRSVPTRL
ncbi:GGDEF family protein (plasmid) [Roseomonas mucosa]|uniref:diguanylate cyclase n=1 Tax=Roseomonas mucosa TaxID=207340 RepID=A0A4Y1MR76_9PROT|nr:GGDEF family protein [Roseomonas mucosa]